MGGSLVLVLHTAIYFLTLVHSQVSELDHRFFLGQIIEKYGHNGTISFEGFERLYKNLGLGNESETESNSSTREHNSTDSPGISVEKDYLHSRVGRHIDTTNKSDDCESEEELAKIVNQHNEVPRNPVTVVFPLQRCLSPHELLTVYGLQGSSGSLSPVNFLHLCPAIIYELDQQTCVWREDWHHHQPAMDEDSIRSSWVFAVLTILVISISGLFSVALVPLLQKSLINQLVSFLVALAVGTLLGDAFLHLIPHALESHVEKSKSHTNSLMKTGVMFLTVVFFFTFEAVLNCNRTRKEKHRVPEEDTHYMTVKLDRNEKEVLEMDEGHQHSHTHSNIALMVIMGDGLHNLTDGLAIGAAFSGGLAPGFATALAVFTHELPHELGDFAVLIQSGMTVQRALLYNLLSSVLSFFGVVFGLVIGNFGDSTHWIYAITAGSFIYIALSNLVPEINRQTSNFGTIVLRLSGILCGGALMGCIALFEHDIQHLFL